MRLISRALVALLVGTLAASASTITGPISIGGPATGSGAVVTPSPGNNNAPGSSSPNFLILSESVSNLSNYWSANFSLPGTVAASTEYNVIKTITNNTGQTWGSYFLYIGSGTILMPSAPTDTGFPLSFDSDSSITLSGLGTGSQTLGVTGPKYISWDNLSIQPGDTITLTFAIDTCANCNGGWAIQQYATGSSVPEPGAYALMGSGLLFLGLRLRKRNA